MNSQRLSLSSSVFAGRIKKFDSYQHDPRTSQRATSRAVKTVAPSNLDFAAAKPRATRKIQQTVSYKIATDYIQLKQSLTRNFDWGFFVGLPLSVHQLALEAVAQAPSSGEAAIADQFEETQIGRKLKTKLSKFHMTFYGFGIAMFLFAGAVSVQTLLTNNDTKEQLGVLGEQTQTADEQGVVEGTGGEPAETEVSAQAIANYRVDPELPRYLRIPDLGVFARIKVSGVDKNGAVDAPKNVNDVSWFNESTLPGGSVGSSLLLGHVSGWTAAGVFKKIDQLKPGMRFEVEKGSGEKLTYEVVRGEHIPLSQVDMSKILGTEVAGEHDLKLMTCSGKYNKTTRQYEDRYVVYARILR